MGGEILPKSYPNPPKTGAERSSAAWGEEQGEAALVLGLVFFWLGLGGECFAPILALWTSRWGFPLVLQPQNQRIWAACRAGTAQMGAKYKKTPLVRCPKLQDLPQNR